jgi:hypothetical protein
LMRKHPFTRKKELHYNLIWLEDNNAKVMLLL